MWSLLLVSNACSTPVVKFNMLMVVYQIFSSNALDFTFIYSLLNVIFLSEEGLTNISNVVESGLGLPTPEELVRNESIERPANDSTVLVEVDIFLLQWFILYLMDLILYNSDCINLTWYAKFRIKLFCHFANSNSTSNAGFCRKGRK